MKPSKTFLFTLALVAVAGITVILTPARVRAADAAEPFPLSTSLTPAMVDFFGLAPAFERPSIAALVACHDTAACAASDSAQVRFLDAAGATIQAYDRRPTSTIEQVRRERLTLTAGVTESRTLLRRYSIDEQQRVVMSGTDSIVRHDAGGAGRDASTLVRLHRYADVRYRVNDPKFPWPMTGLVILELSHRTGTGHNAPSRAAGHAAVSFDGTKYARVLTAGALTHRVNLQARLLETTVPDR